MRIQTQSLFLTASLLVLAACETTPSAPVSDEAVVDTVTVTASRGDSVGVSEDRRMESVVVGASADADYAEPSPMKAALSERSRPTPDAISIIPEPPEQPPVQSGLLTAGDYDDVLNPDLYKSYLDKKLQGSLGDKDLPYIDANQRINIEVIDRLGKAVPLTDLSILSASGDLAFPLRTGADGKAYLFPSYDDLSVGMKVAAGVEGEETVTASLTPELIDNGGTLTFDFDIDRTLPSKLDLLLTLDATGSMSDEMAYLQAELVSILDRVADSQDNLDIRAGFIVYRDKGDAYVVRDYAFTGDLEAMKAELSEQSADGGGDMPEAMHQALSRGLDFEWRDDAVKINLLVADAPPHDDQIQATWDSGLISRAKGIHIVSLSGSGIDETAEFLMRGLSQLTNARYLFLTDDSGVGNPHAEPTVDCYVVTRLDQLVERVFASLITGERVEPDGDDVIRTVGDYRGGVCAKESGENS